MRALAPLALALAAAPAFAQAPAPATTVDTAPTDPARLAAARRVIDQLWPIGTYRRLMQGTMSKMMDTMVGQMLDMKGPQGGSGAESSAAGAPGSGRTLGEMAAAKDPYFRERMRITMDTMTAEMIPLMERIEPRIREALSTSYAKRFDVRQLADMDAFFRTPSGHAYAEQAMTIFADPEMMKTMTSFLPELVKSMPQILAKVQAATAHLPPPPKPETKK